MRGIHHREPGIAGFGLMNRDVYAELIADPFHLDQRIVDHIFTSKKSDRIIIISDSVKDSMIHKGADGVRNDMSKLPSGSIPIKESADCLIRRGLKKESVIEAISGNPEKYFQKIQ